MSRIGKKPITIPDNVTISLPSSDKIVVKGPKGELSLVLHPLITVEIKNEEKKISVSRKSDENLGKSLHGLFRSLINNLIQGTTKGFEKKLEIKGIGFRGIVQGKKLNLSLGFSHPVEFAIPEGITIEFDKEKKNIFTVSGIDKQLVGESAAKIRALRKPEPYKGKGIKYLDEKITIKAGKTATGAKE